MCDRCRRCKRATASTGSEQAAQDPSRQAAQAHRPDRSTRRVREYKCHKVYKQPGLTCHHFSCRPVTGAPGSSSIRVSSLASAPRSVGHHCWRSCMALGWLVGGCGSVIPSHTPRSGRLVHVVGSLIWGAVVDLRTFSVSPEADGSQHYALLRSQTASPAPAGLAADP